MVATLRFVIVVSAIFALFAVLFGAETSKAADVSVSSDQIKDLCAVVRCGNNKVCRVENKRARCVARPRDCELICTERYEPVCGDDGNTYT